MPEAIGLAPDQMRELSTRFLRCGDDLRTSRTQISQSIAVTWWAGNRSDRFRSEWQSIYGPSLNTAGSALDALAQQLLRQMEQQIAASAAGGGSPGVSGGGRTNAGDPGHGAGGGPRSDDAWWEVLRELVNPVRAIAFSVGAIRYALGLSDVLPTLNNNFLVQPLLGGSRLGPWLASPAATNLFRRVGIAGGVLGTGLGLWHLWQQGNPADAFARDPGSYASDVAGTVFSAASTAFLIAAATAAGTAALPVTAVIAGVAAVAWVGTEIWDHWDSISRAVGTAWDAAGDVAGAAWDIAADGVGAVTGAVSGAMDAAADAASELGDRLTFWN